ncbi:hypothetical protein ABID62_009001 [Bradyrhizobium sp. S3.9.1]
MLTPQFPGIREFCAKSVQIGRPDDICSRGPSLAWTRVGRCWRQGYLGTWNLSRSARSSVRHRNGLSEWPLGNSCTFASQAHRHRTSVVDDKPVELTVVPIIVTVAIVALISWRIQKLLRLRGRSDAPNKGCHSIRSHQEARATLRAIRCSDSPLRQRPAYSRSQGVFCFPNTPEPKRTLRSADSELK